MLSIFLEFKFYRSKYAPIVILELYGHKYIYQSYRKSVRRDWNIQRMNVLKPKIFRCEKIVIAIYTMYSNNPLFRINIYE